MHLLVHSHCGQIQYNADLNLVQNCALVIIMNFIPTRFLWNEADLNIVMTIVITSENAREGLLIDQHMTGIQLHSLPTLLSFITIFSSFHQKHPCSETFTVSRHDCYLSHFFPILFQICSEAFITLLKNGLSFNGYICITSRWISWF